MTEQIANTFLNKLSFAGVEALYALKLSYEKNKAFDRIDYVNKAYSTSEDYFNGILAVCYALDIVDFNRTGAVLTITNINSTIKDSIEKYLTAKATTTPSWKQYIDKTDNYFS